MLCSLVFRDADEPLVLGIEVAFVLHLVAAGGNDRVPFHNICQLRVQLRGPMPIMKSCHWPGLFVGFEDVHGLVHVAYVVAQALCIPDTTIES